MLSISTVFTMVNGYLGKFFQLVDEVGSIEFHIVLSVFACVCVLKPIVSILTVLQVALAH